MSDVVEARGGIDPAVRQLLLGIGRTFPDVGRRMRRRARSMGSVRFATCAMMEEFSQATTDAIRHRNETTARDHLNYVARLLASDNPKIFEYVDVYYVEVLMFGLDEKSKKWGWRLVPEKLQRLYVKFWGGVPAK